MTAEPEATIKQSLTVEPTNEDDSYVEPIDAWADYKEWRLQEELRKQIRITNVIYGEFTIEDFSSD